MKTPRDFFEDLHSKNRRLKDECDRSYHPCDGWIGAAVGWGIILLAVWLAVAKGR